VGLIAFDNVDILVSPQQIRQAATTWFLIGFQSRRSRRAVGARVEVI